MASSDSDERSPAMRALAFPPRSRRRSWGDTGLVELSLQAGVGGLSVSCCRGRILQITGRDGDGPQRAAMVAAVAGVLGRVPAQASSHVSAAAWLEAAGQVRGVPAEVFTR